MGGEWGGAPFALLHFVFVQQLSGSHNNGNHQRGKDPCPLARSTATPACTSCAYPFVALSLSHLCVFLSFLSPSFYVSVASKPAGEAAAAAPIAAVHHKAKDTTNRVWDDSDDDDGDTAGGATMDGPDQAFQPAAMVTEEMKMGV